METNSATEKTNLLAQAQALKATQQSAADKNTTAETTQADSGGEFASFMRNALGKTAGAEVNEEELFAALVEQKLTAVSPEAGEFFLNEKAKFMTSMARADGYVNIEDVTVAALKSTLADGKVDQETAERINGEAFAGAQLDDNLEALYDSRGSENDPTIAVSEMEAALMSMRIIMDKIDSGEMSVAARSLDTPSNSPAKLSAGVPSLPSTTPTGEQQLDGVDGFLWKPESDSDGKLIVLLPTTLKGLIERVEIHSILPPTDASKIAEGRFTNDTENGGRAHYRFDETGGDYGDDLNLVVFKSDGTTATWNIAEGAVRND